MNPKAEQIGDLRAPGNREFPVVPKHIGIIMDGNRRFAKNVGEDLLKGHEYGVDKIEEVLEWCQELGVKRLPL